MALKDLFKLVDDKLESEFNKKAFDPTKARNPVLRGIDRTKTQFTATEPQRGRKWFTVKNSVVRFDPPFAIGGNGGPHFIPSERFPDFLSQLKAAVAQGELDGDLERGSGTAKSTGRKRAGWSPERRAAYEAKRAGK